uniref:Uncharacterized protein n=1 Tax=Oryza sativa subsp. japonica TaxID=39947 RepID=Q8S6Y0_ORYSJ|nr:hypothetical protein [Oryza sativa Japonica Group]
MERGTRGVFPPTLLHTGTAGCGGFGGGGGAWHGWNGGSGGRTGMTGGPHPSARVAGGPARSFWDMTEENARGGEGRAGAIDYFLYIDARYFARVPSTSQCLLPLRSASSGNDL